MCFLLFQITLKPGKNLIINAPEQRELRLKSWAKFQAFKFISGTNLVRVLSWTIIQLSATFEEEKIKMPKVFFRATHLYPQPKLSEAGFPKIRDCQVCAAYF